MIGMDRCLCCCSRFNGRSKTTISLSCPNEHSLCKTCTPHFLQSQLSSNIFPIVCVICKVGYSDTALHNVMSQKLKEKFEEIKDVRSHADDTIYLTCQNTSCGCTRSVYVARGLNYSNTTFSCLKCTQYTCFVCLAALPSSQGDAHSVGCCEFADIKRDFDRAIAHGAAFKCPKCGIRGRKSYGCNNIHCDCGAMWCYLCERKVPRNNAHHCTFDWTHGTCYMSLDKLHRFKTCLMLHQVYLEHGREKFSRMWSKYPSVRAHGYSLQEIERIRDHSYWKELSCIVLILLIFLFIAEVVATKYM